MEKNKALNYPKVILSTLWIFYVLNILYADVLNLMSEAATTTSEAEELINTLLSPEMLLSTAVFLELAMVMVILSRLLKHGINRWANIIVASLHTLGLIASVFVGTPTIYYIFFLVVEVSTLLFISWYAWSWKEHQNL